MRVKSLAQEQNTVPWLFGIYDVVYVYNISEKVPGGGENERAWSQSSRALLRYSSMQSVRNSLIGSKNALPARIFRRPPCNFRQKSK